MAEPRSRREANPGAGLAPVIEKPPRLPYKRRARLDPPGAQAIQKAAKDIHDEAGDLPQLFFPPIDPKARKSALELYTPDYCELVVQYLGRGYTLSAFAGAAGVSRDTIWKWGAAHDEFIEAVKIAKLACQTWWEGQLLEVAAKGTHTSGRVTAIQFALKNLAKDDWTEIQRHEVSGPNGEPLNAFGGSGAPAFDTSRLSTEELIQLEHLIAKASTLLLTEGTR